MPTLAEPRPAPGRDTDAREAAFTAELAYWAARRGLPPER